MLEGSIPACAGEPSLAGVSLSISPVYPRVCGGTAIQLGVHLFYRGLSPRVRGNLAYDNPGDRVFGSIPACAGEPSLYPMRYSFLTVYPRVCGGTRVGIHYGHAMWGLSPRVRGNHLGLVRWAERTGSIPACAGEPAYLCAYKAKLPVYPRVCGGTHLGFWLKSPHVGLSPRVRGNRKPPPA